MRRSKYSTDLSGSEWARLKLHLPASKKRGRGRPRIHSLRAILDAIFYVLKSGCPWRLLPRCFPPWKSVYHWFRKWRIDGTFEQLNTALRERLRTRLGRNPQPSAGIVDSQSAKTSGVGGEARGSDGGKKVRGRKRHLLVEVPGPGQRVGRAGARAKRRGCASHAQANIGEDCKDLGTGVGEGGP